LIVILILAVMVIFGGGEYFEFSEFLAKALVSMSLKEGFSV
jgi:hypothetical protein